MPKSVDQTISAPADENLGDETANRPEFVDYYTRDDVALGRQAHFSRLRDSLLAIRAMEGDADRALDVADIGGGTGDCSVVWAEKGHKPICIDIGRDLIEAGRTRAKALGLDIGYEVGSATALPLASGSVDIALLPELLEHVEDWQACLDEAARIVRPGGLIQLSTNNKINPRQQEFRLPFYSWYPGPIKRYCVRRTLDDRPEWANYATFPAVNWFTPGQLIKALRRRGFDQIYSRADLAAARGLGGWKGSVLAVLKAAPILYWPIRTCSQSTFLVAKKQA
ncbi:MULTISPECIES: class I SAM-dependent methyltransferase [unclassified Iodidimonas]|jgi:2-polyprenyl-6-hydroxyphenyl methylase/3-demethylubiquinone-9 3-methyltransferase|uniref:class I SAM-dependent methyltransferase n=1 Tax=unclassified Iodidimonas TaxID=2626145 RepID=UPI002483219D|nr:MULTISPECIES: class I SAM-dependent methyltransferase [unclassified Iodidimonas]